MKDLLKTSEFDFVGEKDKAFIVEFDCKMEKLGYTCNKTIGEGYCWGKHMIIYTKSGVKSKKSYARIYMRESDIILRMYFSNVNKHAQAIEQAPQFIKDGFTGDYGRCHHCKNKKDDGSCSHRKVYTIDKREYELCDGFAFWFFEPTQERLEDYFNLFLTFYPERKRKKNTK